MYVKDVMTPNVISVRPDDSVSAAARLMLENKISGLPDVYYIVKNIGIVTLAD
jgi:CBS domain-containing protein